MKCNYRRGKMMIFFPVFIISFVSVAAKAEGSIPLEIPSARLNKNNGETNAEEISLHSESRMSDNQDTRVNINGQMHEIYPSEVDRAFTNTFNEEFEEKIPPNSNIVQKSFSSEDPRAAEDPGNTCNQFLECPCPSGPIDENEPPESPSETNSETTSSESSSSESTESYTIEPTASVTIDPGNTCTQFLECPSGPIDENEPPESPSGPIDENEPPESPSGPIDENEPPESPSEIKPDTSSSESSSSGSGNATYAEFGALMFFNGSFVTTCNSINPKYYLKHKGNVAPGYNCPFLPVKPFIQKATALVRTVGKSINPKYYLSWKNVTSGDNCPFLPGKPFIQRGTALVRTVGNSLVYNAKKKDVMVVDQFGMEIVSKNIETGKIVTLSLIGHVLFKIIPTTVDDEYVILIDDAVLLLKNKFTKNELITKYNKIFMKFKDVFGIAGSTDPKGGFWIAAMRKSDCYSNRFETTLYLVKNGMATIKTTNNQLIGGMAWSKNGTHLYSTCIIEGTIYDYNTDTSKSRVLFDINKHFNLSGIPFDVTIDNEGNIWATLFGGSSVLQIDSYSGNLLRIIAVPTHYPVSVTFGGILNDKLYVSSAYAEYPTLDLASTFAISNLNVTGCQNKMLLDTTKTFGKKIQHIPEADYSAINDATKYTYNLNSGLIFKRKEANTCGFLSNRTIGQQVPLNIETITMSLHYDIKNNAVFLADMHRPAVIKYNPDTGTNVTIVLKGSLHVSCIIPIKYTKNHYVVAVDQKLVLFKNKFQKSGTTDKPFKKVLADIKAEDLNIVFSNGKVDPDGRLWIGTKHATHAYPHHSANCNLYLLDKNKLHVMESNISSSGGMAWSKDYKYFYFIDAGLGRIYKYNYKSSKLLKPFKSKPRLTNRTILFDMKDHKDKISGTVRDMVMDNEEFLWVTVEAGAAMIRIDSTNGKIATIRPLRMANPNTITFAGPLRDQLYIGAAKASRYSVDDVPIVMVVSDLGVSASRKQTDRFVYKLINYIFPRV